MNTATMVFLIFWMPNSELPAAKFIKSFHSMKECTATLNSVKDKEIRSHLSCIQVVAEPLPTAGQPF